MAHEEALRCFLDDHESQPFVEFSRGIGPQHMQRHRQRPGLCLGKDVLEDCRTDSAVLKSWRDGDAGKERRILAALRESGPMTPGQISEVTGIPRATVYQRLNALASERKGRLVEDMGDGRWRGR